MIKHCWWVCVCVYAFMSSSNEEKWLEFNEMIFKSRERNSPRISSAAFNSIWLHCVEAKRFIATWMSLKNIQFTFRHPHNFQGWKILKRGRKFSLNLTAKKSLRGFSKWYLNEAWTSGWRVEWMNRSHLFHNALWPRSCVSPLKMKIKRTFGVKIAV